MGPIVTVDSKIENKFVTETMSISDFRLPFSMNLLGVAMASAAATPYNDI